MGSRWWLGHAGWLAFREQVLNYGPNQCGVHVNGADAADIAWGINEALSDQERMRRWGRERAAAGGGDVHVGAVCGKDGGGLRAGRIDGGAARNYVARRR